MKVLIWLFHQGKYLFTTKKGNFEIELFSGELGDNRPLKIIAVKSNIEI